MQALPSSISFPRAIVLCLLAGGLSVLSFAPFKIWPLQLIALATLFYSAQQMTSIQRVAWLGWAFAFSSLAIGTHWLYVSLHDYGGLHPLLTVSAVLLLAAGLGLLYAAALAAAAWLSHRIKNISIAYLLIMPACWMLADWTRGWIFTGFSWLATGYAHTASPLSAYAAYVGVYGLSWLAGLLAGCIALMLHQKSRNKLALGLLLGLPLFGLILQTHSWTTPIGSQITVRLLQGNVAQEMKFAPNQLNQTLLMYQQMLIEQPADLIVTPETALPVFPSELPADYLKNLSDFAQTTRSQLIIGLPWTTAPDVYFNSVLGLGTNNTTPYRYDKHHLVPFGEFIPLGAHWFINLMHIPLGDFTRGQEIQAAMPVKDQWILPNICYEDLFGEEIAHQLRAAQQQGKPVASVLLNVSNIAWFGDTIALPQHLQISQMRTLETGRPMLRATNTGATAIINAQGELLASLPAFERATLTGQVQGMQGQTPYILFGNFLPVGLACSLLFLLWLRARRNHS